MSANGTWNVTFRTPMGNQDAKLSLQTSEGRLTGEIVSPRGTAQITDGSVDGELLQWKASISQPIAMTMEFTAKVEGDQISGDAKLGGYGNASFAGTRA